MSKEQQVEELAKLIYNNYDCSEFFSKDMAELLYDEGYRKTLKGKWILHQGIIDYCTCSHCGSMISQGQVNRFYCPRCGTEMEE